MRVLSLQQPWAWLVVNGHKDVENRTWATSYRGIVAIHASLRVSAEYPDDSRFPLPRPIAVPSVHEIERGGIVGVCEIVDCVTASDSPWFAGPGYHGFVLRDAAPLPFIACRGALGLRVLPPELEEQVQAALVRARSSQL